MLSQQVSVHVALQLQQCVLTDLPVENSSPVAKPQLLVIVPGVLNRASVPIAQKVLHWYHRDRAYGSESRLNHRPWHALAGGSQIIVHVASGVLVETLIPTECRIVIVGTV